MFITINESSPELLKFTLSSTTISFANSLRRILLSEIPMLAIDMVEIEKNYTPLPDELISHRIGLIPIKSDNLLKSSDECECSDFCKECSYNLYLNVENADNETCYEVTSADFNDDIITDKNIYIVKLAYNQNLKLRAIVRRGIAKDHAKFMSCVVTYDYDLANKSRHTIYRIEKSADEWPGLNEEEPDFKEPNEVYMGIEVVPKQIDPIKLLSMALTILRSKLERIKIALNE
ncbi:DNA-directed RNA polymerase II subunit RPB3 [Dictyocoela muelleri]|nr:DNA-directed RNA polymerase II subunit RPB3 [Dictyocoela muelleri]